MRLSDHLEQPLILDRPGATLALRPLVIGGRVIQGLQETWW
jgi:hypothetical protein